MFVEEKYVKLQKVKDYIQNKIYFFADETTRFKLQNDKTSASLCQLIHGDLTDILTMLNDIDKVELKDSMSVEELNRMNRQNGVTGSCDNCKQCIVERNLMNKKVYSCDKGVMHNRFSPLEECHFFERKEQQNVGI